jgi:uncharacterized protein
MPKESKIEKIKEIVKRRMEGLGPSHDFLHVLRVYNLCKKIAKSEKNVDFEVLELAALLHDIGRKKEDLDKTGEIDHAIESAKMAERILEKFSFPKEKIEKIKGAIISHRFKTNSRPISIEGKILSDADKLDVIGAIGIVRSCCWLGENMAKIWSDVPLEVYIKENLTKERRIKDKSKHALNFEYEIKLKHVYKKLYTKAAKRIAKERNEFMKKFFKQLKKEFQ